MKEMKLKELLRALSLSTAIFHIFLPILPDLVFLKVPAPEGKLLEMRRAGWNALKLSICFNFREMPDTVVWAVPDGSSLKKKYFFFLLGNADSLKFKPITEL